MGFDWRKLLRDRRAWAVAGIGGVVGVVLYLRARGGQPSTPSTGLNTGEVGPYTSMAPSVYDSSLQDIWEGFNQVAADQQAQISEIQAQLDTDTPPSTTTPTTSGPTRATATWQGSKLTSQTTWQALAAKVAASKTPEGIESTKRALLERNPTLAKQTQGGKLPLRSGWNVLIPTWPKAG